MDMLTVNEVAALKGCTERYITKAVKNGTLKGILKQNAKNRPKWYIPLDALPQELQLKYIERQKAKVAGNAQSGQQKAVKRLEEYTAPEREEIAAWTDIIERWQAYRNKPGAIKAGVDAQYVTLCRLEHPGREISIQILYRRARALREGNYDGLLDNRGKARKGKTDIDETLWQAFLSFYLAENQHPLKKCWEYTRLWAQNERPELVDTMPVYTTFYRRVQTDLPEPVKVLGREGEKAYRDRCAPYIRRVYDDMLSNEWWVADNHTFDVISQGEDGQRHRLYLTAFFDARSGIFTGCCVNTSASSNGTLLALRKGILKYGIPDNIYVDNGREFLTHDIGGLGHRRKKSKGTEPVHEPPPIFARLGIKMTNAIVRNAKAKIIERRFRDVKDHLSRLFETYTGGSVVEKPEKLKHVLKAGKIPSDSELTAAVEELLGYYFNEQPYHGPVSADQGKKRIDVYNEHLVRRRMASPEELSLMLMRSSRLQQVTRRGVKLDIAGQRLDYISDGLLQLIGQKVYYRYDPDDLSEVRIYDTEDRYLMTVPVDNKTVLAYGSSQEQVKTAMAQVRRAERLTKEALKSSTLPGIGSQTALELVLAQAQADKAARVEGADPKILELQRADEQPAYPQAVGASVTIDMAKLVNNAAKRQGGYDDGEI